MDVDTFYLIVIERIITIILETIITFSYFWIIDSIEYLREDKGHYHYTIEELRVGTLCFGLPSECDKSVPTINSSTVSGINY